MRPPKSLAQILIAAILLGVTLIQSGCASREERIDSIARKAENALFEGDREKALSILAKGVKKYEDSSPLFEAYANALAEAGQWDQAATAMQTAIRLDPVRKSLWVNLGDYREQAGQIPQAIEALEEYVAFDSEDFLAWKKLYQLKARSNDLTGAIDAALSWNRLRPSARPSLALGDLFLASGNSAQARSWYAQSAAYTSETHAKLALSRLISLEADTKQYLQAEIRIEEYESRYGPGDTDNSITNAKLLIERWHVAQEEMAKAGQELLTQRSNLKKNSPTPPQTKVANQQTPPTSVVAPEVEEPEVSQGEPATTAAPTPLFETTEPSPTPTVTPQRTAPVVSNSNRNAPIPSISESSIDTLWGVLGDHPENVDAWLQLARLYAEKEEWFDAEACILEAKRRQARSEPIIAEYITIIANTQPRRQVVQEADAHFALFPNSPSVALSRARAFRTIKASGYMVKQAYRDCLNLAVQGSAEHREATRYLNTGN